MMDIATFQVLQQKNIKADEAYQKKQKEIAALKEHQSFLRSIIASSREVLSPEDLSKTKAELEDTNKRLNKLQDNSDSLFDNNLSLFAEA